MPLLLLPLLLHPWPGRNRLLPLRHLLLLLLLRRRRPLPPRVDRQEGGRLLLLSLVLPLTLLLLLLLLLLPPPRRPLLTHQRRDPRIGCLQRLRQLGLGQPLRPLHPALLDPTPVLPPGPLPALWVGLGLGWRRHAAHNRQGRCLVFARWLLLLLGRLWECQIHEVRGRRLGAAGLEGGGCQVWGEDGAWHAWRRLLGRCCCCSCY
jgi:hypothetical protein